MLRKFFDFVFSPIYKLILSEIQINYFTDDLVRLGKNNDGGYLVLKSSITRYSKLLSFGIGGDISFEKDFQKFNNSEIFCFDPTIDNLPEILPNFYFNKLGIDSINNGEYIDLKQAMLLANIPNNSKIFMKMDIEGFEWNVLKDKKSFKLLKEFDQIVIELHLKYLLGKSKYLMPIELIRRLFILKKLKKHFYFYNLNANNVCGYINFKKFVFPEVVEVSMLNKKGYLVKLSNLNQPSDPSLVNIQEFFK